MYGAIKHLQKTVQALEKAEEEHQRDDETPSVDPTLACPMVLFHKSILRNKRCVLSYLEHRIEKITRSRFEVGSVLGSEMSLKMSGSEKQFFNDYNQLLDTYMEAVDIDLANVTILTLFDFIFIDVSISCRILYRRRIL